MNGMASTKSKKNILADSFTWEASELLIPIQLGRAKQHHPTADAMRDAPIQLVKALTASPRRKGTVAICQSSRFI